MQPKFAIKRHSLTPWQPSFLQRFALQAVLVITLIWTLTLRRILLPVLLVFTLLLWGCSTPFLILRSACHPTLEILSDPDISYMLHGIPIHWNGFLIGAKCPTI